MSDSYEPRAGQGHDGDDNHVSTRTAGEKALAKARRERDEMREAICAWAEAHDWAHPNWKEQPANAKLFSLANRYKEGKA